MKILHLSTSDIGGGAARAAYRLHRALLNEKVDSLMLVQDKKSDDYTVMNIAENKFQKGFNLLRPFTDQLPVKFYKNRTKTLFSLAWLGFNNVIKKIEKIDPDVVHLHWICGGMIKIEDLARIKKPIVWSLHDTWAFTGGCHIKWKCEKYKYSCGACPRLGSKKNSDLSRWIWKRKKKTFKKMDNLIINGLSNWIMNCSKESSLLNNKKHINLPNPIDTTIFKLFNPEKSRELWNLPKDKKLVLFGAMNATSDINKGFKELSEALQKLELDNVEFVVFGSSQLKSSPKFKFKTHYLGKLNDNISLITLYNAVNVMLVPSLQENLSNVIMESLSCSTPVVAFNVGGNNDMIEHKINGYLARPFNTTDLANGIKWVLDNQNYDQLCQKAREKVLKEFDSQIVTKKYIKLYEELTDRNKKK